MNRADRRRAAKLERRRVLVEQCHGCGVVLPVINMASVVCEDCGNPVVICGACLVDALAAAEYGRDDGAPDDLLDDAEVDLTEPWGWVQ
jgi:hypothetical protein